MKGAEEERRAYWAQQMELAHAFMGDILRYPFEESGDCLASLAQAVQDAKIEVVYAGTQIGPGMDRQFYLRESLIRSFLAIASELNSCGLMLKVEDAYRDPDMQKHLALEQVIFDTVLRRVIWEREGQLPDVPTVRRRLGAVTAIYPKVATHMCGSALDISVLSRDTGDELDRGAPYLELSELTPMASPFVDGHCRANRERITSLMRKHGFVAYPYEFWHYSSGDAIAERVLPSGNPGRHGPVVRNVDNSVTPIENPTRPLVTDEEIAARIAKAVSDLGTVERSS